MIVHPSTHLTSNYRRDEGSNNYKLLDLGHQQHLKIFKTLRLIELWRDVDEAEGFTLDKIGKNVLELREGRDDVPFRKAIKIKIRGNMSAGTVEDFNVIAEILFDNAFERISETWPLEQYGHEPAALSLSLLNMTREQMFDFRGIRDILEPIAAGGVRLFFDIKSMFRFQNHNSLKFIMLIMQMAFKNRTKPYILWNGALSWDGTRLFNSSAEGIRFIEFRMSSTFNNNNRMAVNRLKISGFGVRYLQPGLSGKLIKSNPWYWDGDANFDGSRKFSGLHGMEEAL